MFLFTSHLAWLCLPIHCKEARVFYLRATLPGCVLQFNAKWRVFFIYEPPCMAVSSNSMQSGACFLFTSHLTCICPPIHCKVARVFYLRATSPASVLRSTAKWRVFFIYEPPHLHLSSDPLQSGACFLFTSHLAWLCPPIIKSLNHSYDNKYLYC
ncbi:Uncharacterised protein [Macrococcoides caseolyticum]|nr:Uncharacterised protein [Macrococcus caseolyticus]